MGTCEWAGKMGVILCGAASGGGGDRAREAGRARGGHRGEAARGGGRAGRASNWRWAARQADLDAARRDLAAVQAKVGGGVVFSFQILQGLLQH